MCPEDRPRNRPLVATRRGKLPAMLTVENVEWSVPPDNVSYQWQSAPLFDGPYEDIPGATVREAPQVNGWLRCIVTAAPPERPS